MQEKIDEVKQLLPASMNDGEVLAFYFKILKKLEEAKRADQLQNALKNQGHDITGTPSPVLDTATKKKAKRKKKNARKRLLKKYTFPLIPQGKLQAQFIRLTNTSLGQLINSLAGRSHS